MKEDIRRILEMNKDGIVSDQQAAELIVELTGFERASASLGAGLQGDATSAPRFKFDPLLHRASAPAYRNDHPAHFAANLITLSCFDPEVDAATQFHHNRINRSNGRSCRFERSEITGNQIESSRVRKLQVQQGRLSDAEIHGSAWDDCFIAESELLRVKMNNSCCRELQVVGESAVRDVRTSSSVLKEIKIADQSCWEKMNLSSVRAVGAASRGSSLLDCEMEAAVLCDVAFEQTQWRSVVLRQLHVHDASFSACHFEELLYAGSEKWGWRKRSLLKDVAFENCRLTKVMFSDCCFEDVVIRNVALKNKQFSNLVLSGQVIDGTEAFLRAVATAQR